MNTSRIESLLVILVVLVILLIFVEFGKIALPAKQCCKETYDLVELKMNSGNYIQGYECGSTNVVSYICDYNDNIKYMDLCLFGLQPNNDRWFELKDRGIPVNCYIKIEKTICE